MRRLLPLLAAPALLAAQSPSAADRTLDRAIARYRTVKTIRASFEQAITNPMTGSTHLSKGTTVQRRPGQIAIRFTNPKDDRIVADGRFVWVYTPSTTPGQVVKLPAGAAGASPPDLMTELFTETRSRFTITDAGRKTAAGRALHALTLVPKPGAAASQMFSQALVWIDTGGVIREFELTDANGLVRKVRFTSLKFNAAVKPSEFVFVVPKGVRVFEGPAS